MNDSYSTIKSEARVETKVKGSRFIGETCRVGSVEEAMHRLEQIRKREYRATHHCYAYLIGRSNQAEFKYSDDGEPSGTAGRPIYDVLVGSGLTDLLIVVTRYYGGTKLGTGGLVRAYSEAARTALEASGRQEHFVTAEYRLVLDHSPYDRWLRTIQQLEAEVIESEFADRVTLRVRVRRSRADKMVAAFTELSSGKGICEEINSDA